MTKNERRALLAVIDGIFYRVGLLKGTKADEALERELAAELESMWNEWCDARVSDMMGAIPEELTEEAVAYIRDMLADALGPDFANSEKVKNLLESYIREAYLNGKKGIKAVVPNTPAELGKMNVFDSNAVRILNKHNCFWLGEHYGKDIGPKIAELTAKAVREGTGRKQLAKDLKEALGGQAGGNYKYWDVAASAALVRSRSFGCISGMSEAEISEYEILAMGDERMCATCGNMNGRVFSVSQAMDKIKSVLDIEDPEEFKNAMPWGGFDPKSSNDKLMSQGRAVPPFHGRCRCVIVATAFTDVETPSREYILDNAFGGTKREKEALKKAFEDAPDEFMPLLQRYGREINIQFADDVEGGHFVVKNKMIEIQNGLDDERELLTIRHESGHLFDYIFGRERGQGVVASYYDGAAYSAFQNDRARFMGNSPKQLKYLASLRSAIENRESPYFNNRPVSDIFCSMTDGQVHGRSGHDAEYYQQNPIKAPTEVFADLLMLYLRNDKESVGYVRQFFPETVAAFERILKEEIDYDAKRLK